MRTLLSESDLEKVYLVTEDGVGEIKVETAKGEILSYEQYVNLCRYQQSPVIHAPAPAPAIVEKSVPIYVRTPWYLFAITGTSSFVAAILVSHFIR